MDWVVQERKDRADREVREAERKAKRDANQLQGSLGSLARLGIVAPSTAGAAVTPTTTVGQQPLGPVFEPTAMITPSTSSISSTLSTPFIDVAAIGEEAAGHVAGRLQGFTHGNTDESPSRLKPIVNGTTDSGPITPPGT